MPYGTFLEAGLNEPTGMCCDLRIKHQRHDTKEIYILIVFLLFLGDSNPGGVTALRKEVQ